jgi:hypothetical protein
VTFEGKCEKGREIKAKGVHKYSSKHRLIIGGRDHSHRGGRRREGISSSDQEIAGKKRDEKREGGNKR